MRKLFFLLLVLSTTFGFGCREGSIDKPNNIPNDNDSKNIVPNDEIWYTSTSTTVPTNPTDPTDDWFQPWPYNPSIFGVNIVSNTYDTDKECWVIKFDGEVTRVGEMAFWECLSITSVALPDSVTQIKYSAFKGCVNLTTISLGNGVTTIGSRAFYDCVSLADIVLPDSVTTIKSGAFNGCRSLTNITLSNNVTFLGDRTFAHCSGLTDITLSDNLEVIEEQTFYGCTNLTSITLPQGVTAIGHYAFFDCMNLASIYCMATTPPTLGEYVFNIQGNTSMDVVPIDCPIYVPTESVDAYKAAPGWSDYASKIVGCD